MSDDLKVANMSIAAEAIRQSRTVKAFSRKHQKIIEKLGLTVKYKLGARTAREKLSLAVLGLHSRREEVRALDKADEQA